MQQKLQAHWSKLISRVAGTRNNRFEKAQEYRLHIWRIPIRSNHANMWMDDFSRWRASAIRWRTSTHCLSLPLQPSRSKRDKICCLIAVARKVRLSQSKFLRELMFIQIPSWGNEYLDTIPNELLLRETIHNLASLFLVLSKVYKNPDVHLSIRVAEPVVKCLTPTFPKFPTPKHSVNKIWLQRKL